MARIKSIERHAEKDSEMKLSKLETDNELKVTTEIELEKLKHSFETQQLGLRNQLHLQTANFKVELEKQKSEKLAHARDPKKPYFEESKDKMDSYLPRFEQYATAYTWDKSFWAAYLRTLLIGRAFEVYNRLSTEDAADWE